jgi:hypothetical protein
LQLAANRPSLQNGKTDAMGSGQQRQWTEANNPGPLHSSSPLVGSMIFYDQVEMFMFSAILEYKITVSLLS